MAITGAGSNQKGDAQRGTRLRGHHWPERWVTDPEQGGRSAELFIAGELLAAGGRAVLETMLHEAAHALARARGIKDTSAEGNRYHNKRFVALAEELGLRGPERAEKVIGWSGCTLTDETADGYAEIIKAIDTARLPYLADIGLTGGDGTGTGEDGDGQGGGDGKPRKRGGRHVATVCGCTPARRLQLTPKQLEDGPIVCGNRREEFRTTEEEEEEEEGGGGGGGGRRPGITGPAPPGLAQRPGGAALAFRPEPSTPAPLRLPHEELPSPPPNPTASRVLRVRAGSSSGGAKMLSRPWKKILEPELDGSVRTPEPSPRRVGGGPTAPSSGHAPTADLSHAASSCGSRSRTQRKG